MAKKSIRNRQSKRVEIVSRFKVRREKLLDIARDLNRSDDERFEARLALQKLPRDASPVRLRNRCAITGRPRGVYRKFGLARTKLRELAMSGVIPGLTKSSW
jgi:small subunit ribosomal protein S14